MNEFKNVLKRFLFSISVFFNRFISFFKYRDSQKISLKKVKETLNLSKISLECMKKIDETCYLFPVTELEFYIEKFELREKRNCPKLKETVSKQQNALWKENTKYISCDYAHYRMSRSEYTIYLIGIDGRLYELYVSVIGGAESDTDVRMPLFEVCNIYLQGTFKVNSEFCHLFRNHININLDYNRLYKLVKEDILIKNSTYANFVDPTATRIDPVDIFDEMGRFRRI